MAMRKRRGNRGTRGPQNEDQKAEVRSLPRQPIGNQITGILGPVQLLASLQDPVRVGQKVLADIRFDALRRMQQRRF